MPRLELLERVAWEGSVLAGRRLADLLAELVQAGDAGCTDELLLDVLWESAPAVNALQALVSRARRVTGPGVVERTAGRYRLRLPVQDVDVWQLAATTREAELALRAGDAAEVVAAAARAGAAVPSAADSAGGPTGEQGRALTALRRTGAQLTARLRRAVGTALLDLGRAPEALDRLAPLVAAGGSDEDLLLPYLRALAAVHGGARALTRYGELAAWQRDTLGTDPSPALRALHAELLAADRPVRSGVAELETPVLGRDDDRARVRELLRTARVVTLVGAGGIGKTTLAQEVARTATQPVVHLVALAPVTPGGGAVATAVAAAIGVRDGGADGYGRGIGPRTLPDRIAAELEGPPTLLVLDNAEHLVDDVAGLVAQLVRTVPRLSVLVTSRRPLAIAAERVVPLGPLPFPVAAELFRSRVAAVRPDAVLPSEAVAEIVHRLDGVPLALELAAAQMRWRSAGEVAGALDARFEVLRGGLREAPDRHSSLLAVIEWSWDLLDPEAQDALARLSAFHAPFSRAAAAAVLAGGASGGERRGPWAADAVLARLVEHSLLGMEESEEPGRGGVRFRMLETIREFGHLRLSAAGELGVAADAVHDWVVGVVSRLTPQLDGPGQPAALAELVPELPEATEVLRHAAAQDRIDTVLALAPALGRTWIGTRDVGRVGLLVAAGAAVVRAMAAQDGALGDAAAQDAAREVLANAIVVESMMSARPAEDLRAALHGLGPGPDARVGATVRAALVPLDETGVPDTAGLEELTRSPAPATAREAWQWLALCRENAGDLPGAIAAARSALALADPAGPPSQVAHLRAMLAGFLLAAGQLAQVAEQAEAALSVLRMLPGEEVEDMEVVLTVLDVEREAWQSARRRVTELLPRTRGTASMWVRWADAELRIATGDEAGGLARYREVLADADAWFPTQDDGDPVPWMLGALAGTTIAHARVLGPRALETVPELGARCERAVATALHAPRVDLPLTAMLLHAVAGWRWHVSRGEPGDVAQLLVLAELFGLARAPGMGFATLLAEVEAAAPGGLSRCREELGKLTRVQLRERAAQAARPGW